MTLKIATTVLEMEQIKNKIYRLYYEDFFMLNRFYGRI